MRKVVWRREGRFCLRPPASIHIHKLRYVQRVALACLLRGQRYVASPHPCYVESATWRLAFLFLLPHQMQCSDGDRVREHVGAMAARVVMSIARSMPAHIVARLMGIRTDELPAGSQASGEEEEDEERVQYLRWLVHELVESVAGLWDAVCDLVRLETTDNSKVVKSQPGKALLPEEGEEQTSWCVFCACGAPNALLRTSQEREHHDVHLRKVRARSSSLLFFPAICRHSLALRRPPALCASHPLLTA